MLLLLNMLMLLVFILLIVAQVRTPRARSPRRAAVRPTGRALSHSCAAAQLAGLWAIALQRRVLLLLYAGSLVCVILLELLALVAVLFSSGCA